MDTFNRAGFNASATAGAFFVIDSSKVVNDTDCAFRAGFNALTTRNTPNGARLTRNCALFVVGAVYGNL